MGFYQGFRAFDYPPFIPSILTNYATKDGKKLRQLQQSSRFIDNLSISPAIRMQVFTIAVGQQEIRPCKLLTGYSSTTPTQQGSGQQEGKKFQFARGCRYQAGGHYPFLLMRLLGGG